MGSPLGPLFANIFMISLEENILPKLKSYLRNWRRYIDDIFASVLSEKIDLIIHELNSYHSNIKFRYELEIDNKLVFLDVCVTRINKNEIEVPVYRKGTNTNIYINCTLMLHQTEKLIKNCRNHIIDQGLSQSYYWSRIVAIIRSRSSENHDTEQKMQLLVPYSRKQGHQLLSKMKKQLKRTLPDDIQTMISYKSTNLSTKFLVKDKTDFQQKQCCLLM